MRVAIERLLALRGWSLTLLCGAVLAAAICLAFSLAAVSVSQPSNVPLQAQWRRILPLRATLQQRVVHSWTARHFRRWSRLSPASPYRPGNRGGAVAKCLLWLTGRRCHRCLPGLPIAGYTQALFH
uniref:hypothetical protein n=1 Tax=Klebsiella aerogenes TaxID=548 RepID=UPI001D0D8AD4|nr:hypothetical protein [Klebsiella aerogenes]